MGRSDDVQNVSAVRHNSLGVQLLDTPWESLRGISVDREGEQILSLRPRLEKVTHQMDCEIKIENNVKVITFRSTLNVENMTSLPIEMIVVDAHGKADGGALRIGNSVHSPPVFLTDFYRSRRSFAVAVRGRIRETIPVTAAS
jgi:vacuolar protein sorting-associated protein 13A/C